MKKLYRVTIKSAESVQPDDSTFWKREITYTGYDVAEARRAYHENAPLDYAYGPGNKHRETLFEVLDTADLADDDPGVMEETNI